MSDKRRDKKGRILQNNERQRPDGRYEYRYTLPTGEKRSVYSWRLVSTDRLPAGKRDTEALRDAEKRIEKDLNDGIMCSKDADKTIDELFEAYMATRHDLKPTSRESYITHYDMYVRQALGRMRISGIRYTDLLTFFSDCITERGLNFGTIHIIAATLSPIFTSCVRDNVIRTNPLPEAIKEARRRFSADSRRRAALTIPQQKLFLSACRESNLCETYYPIVVFLLGTGCRMCEALGLTWRDCDFDSGLISINHSLVYVKDTDGKRVCSISTPKTRAGTRVIPMLRDVRDILTELRKAQQASVPASPSVDGYTDFVFRARDGGIVSPPTFEHAFERICARYNAAEKKRAAIEHRQPSLLPRVTPHILRHTFCTRLCENETNLKVIQEIMGHANIGITMDIYNEATVDKKKEAVASIEGKVLIGL